MSKFRNNPLVNFQLAKKIYFTILIFSFVWLLMIFIAPVFMNSGGALEKAGSVIYIFFSKVCHQDDSRSFWFHEHKLAVCSRCVWIYAGFFFGTSVYPVKYKLNNIIPPSVWILITAVLLLIADVSLDITGIIPNTIYSRSVTGFIIGSVLPFYIVPGFVKFFYEVNSFLRKKISI